MTRPGAGVRSGDPAQPDHPLLTGLNDEQRKAVMHVDGPLPSLRKVLPAGPRRKSFKDTIRHYGSLWCCNMPPGGRGPGHIWYDFLHDLVPHLDRHNRKWTTPWKPIMGP